MDYSTADIVEMINVLYGMHGCGSGGPLHVVVDDGNVFDYCMRIPPDSSRYYGTDALEQSQLIIDALVPLSESDRKSVLQAYWAEYR